MRLNLLLTLGAMAMAVSMAASAGRTVAAESNTAPQVGEWKAVEEALGRPGQVQAGGVFRVGLPRSDLKVTVQGVEVQPGFALGSYAAFKKIGKSAMIMGDLVLLDQEVNGVMSGLLTNGLTVTALHNHLNEMSPHVMYMHFSGHGNAVELAKGLRAALSASGTPVGPGRSAAGPASGPELDQKQLEAALGRSGRVNNSVFQVTVARAERITEGGIELLPAMGVATALNFQPTGDGKAAITGDLVLIAREVNDVARTLRGHGIDVTAIHQHALADTPRLFYLHFWAHDDAVKLAQGLKAALDQTNSAKPPDRK
jgi:hypothetical protein